MKKRILILLAGFGLMIPTLPAADKAGPKGGKLLEVPEGYVEFFVNPTRQGEIVFYDKELKPQPVAAQEVIVTAGTREKQEKLSVEKTDAQFVTKPLPAGDGYYVILQIKASPDAEAKTLRIRYLEANCAGCNLPEYACTCGH